MSPGKNTASPNNTSPWISHTNPFITTAEEPIFTPATDLFPAGTGLVGSLVREEGPIYSLATAGDLLYTGSDSKSIRVWKDQKDYTGFKCGSGLVKAIVISSNGHIFTGHQDGKIRIWVISQKKSCVHKRVGTFPRLKDYFKTAVNLSNYFDPRRRRRRQKAAAWIRHTDAVSCLALDDHNGLLYSGSWDRTLKIWRLSDSSCVESVNAHEDAVNSVVIGFDGFVFTGSSDGTVKVWLREKAGGERHALAQTLLRQESAVTALTVNMGASILYCGSSDGAVNFWGRCLSDGGVLKGHKLAVLCLASAGDLLFTGSADKTICVWGRDVGGRHSCLSVLTGHSEPVKCLAVEADPAAEAAEERRRWVVYSGSLDKSIKVWKVSDSALQLRPGNGIASPSFDAF